MYCWDVSSSYSEAVQKQQLQVNELKSIYISLLWLIKSFSLEQNQQKLKQELLKTKQKHLTCLSDVWEYNVCKPVGFSFSVWGFKDALHMLVWKAKKICVKITTLMGMSWVSGCKKWFHSLENERVHLLIIPVDLASLEKDLPTCSVNLHFWASLVAQLVKDLPAM